MVWQSVMASEVVERRRIRNERVIIEDMQQHPYCEAFRELAKLADIESCWSQPIRNSKGEVLGTFGIHHRQSTQPTKEEITLIEHYANLAQLGIEHKLANTRSTGK